MNNYSHFNCHNEEHTTDTSKKSSWWFFSFLPLANEPNVSCSIDAFSLQKYLYQKCYIGIQELKQISVVSNPDPTWAVINGLKLFSDQFPTTDFLFHSEAPKTVTIAFWGKRNRGCKKCTCNTWYISEDTKELSLGYLPGWMPGELLPIVPTNSFLFCYTLEPVAAFSLKITLNWKNSPGGVYGAR